MTAAPATRRSLWPAPDLRQRSRIHESGHVIAAAVLDQGPDSVVVFGTGAGVARYWLPTPRQAARMTRAEWAALQESGGIIDLSGQAALEVTGDADPRAGANHDRALALEVARGIDPAAPEAARERLYNRALTLVREHRAAIERFAATLRANHDRLGGREVRIAVAAALGNWPTPEFYDRQRAFRAMVVQRGLFEERYPGLGPDPAWADSWALWIRCEATAWGGPPLVHPPKGGQP